jgi:geranylgeranyl diphosphate synthase type II
MNNIKPFQEAILSSLANLDYPQQPNELYEPIRYILNLGGKRLRPVLTLLAADAYGNWKQAIPQALSVEVFHNFTLVHDDIMDDAPLRRGKETVHEKWDINRAILSGDAMLIQAYMQLVKCDQQHISSLMDAFNKVALEVCEGQQFDVNFEESITISQDQYIEMIRLKTSVLLGAALQFGAIVSNAPEQDQQHLYDFGVKLGIAFQIKDDWLDVYGDPEKFGKQVGGDILANKKTLLMIHALETAKGDQQLELNKWLDTHDQPTQKVKEVTELFTQLRAGEKAKEVMDRYYRDSLESLAKCSAMPNEKRANFETFANWLMERDH